MRDEPLALPRDDRVYVDGGVLFINSVGELAAERSVVADLVCFIARWDPLGLGAHLEADERRAFP